MAKATTKKAGNGFGALLGGAAKKASSTAAKKSSAPAIKLNKELADSLDVLIQAKADAKTAASNLRAAEAKLLEHAKGIQDTDGLADNYSGTYELVGNNDTRMKFIATDKFSVSQDEEVHDAIRSIVGKANYEGTIVKNMAVSLRKDVFEDEEKQALLVELVGEHFEELFVTTFKFTAQAGLKTKIYKMVKGSKAKLEQLRELLPQAKPSIR